MACVNAGLMVTELFDELPERKVKKKKEKIPKIGEM